MARHSSGEDDAVASGRSRLDPEVLAWIEDVAGDGLSAARSQAAFRERWIVPQVLRDVSAVRTATALLDAPVRAPLGIAPIPRLGRVHPSAEAGVARAAAATGLVSCAPTNSSIALEDLPVDPGRSWFQLYPHPDASISADLIARAERSGYAAIVVTVDRPVPGAKPSEASKSTSPDDLPNLARYGRSDVVSGRHDPGFTWARLIHLVATSSLPIVLKGVLSPVDAARAVDAGCAAVWLSNHGGRQLDQAICPLDVLDEVVAAVGDAAAVYLDGGVRRGTDIFIALALGASAVFVGRPVAHGLAEDGQAGVERLLNGLISELRHVMALAGTATVGDISRDCVR